jgi:hypothetical protein
VGKHASVSDLSSLSAILDPDNTVHAAADPPHNVDQAGSTSTAGHTTALDHDSPMIDTFTANDSRGNDAADPANFPPKPFINSTNDPMDIDGILPKEYPVNVHSVRSELDLVHSIKGMYRLLDLYSENGSGGLGSFARLDAMLFELTWCPRQSTK